MAATTARRLLCRSVRLGTSSYALRAVGGLLRPAPAFAAARRNFSGHPDFEPQSNVSGADDNKVHDMLKQLVTENEVVLFMKGNPDMPQCGFSRAVAQALEEVGFSDYAYVNVLKYPEVREGVKKFSDWPTIPQLYVKAEFVGGCDIVMQMHKDGELKEILPKPKTSE
ncbi:unnamed protein product [Cladocopium goreaui]|uniref:Glutaredoxin domain-containing protein n=1 Tax=Cladocopium goreaui TaxID=2562237 RepID=A0A9P1CQU7_9DINO|nr:unnamed protein product [Cladocopium goreaui]|mmetsp:Transcript_85893/g.175325  ORF Transcript_85893/g.175325 Transcript_85893/m.175325 type:complete len:168 (-) Transcript_85893:127-630(-)